VADTANTYGGGSVSGEVVMARGMTQAGKRTVGLESQSRLLCLDLPSESNGIESLTNFPGLNRQEADLTGCAMDSEGLVYFRWSQRAHERQRRPRSSAIDLSAANSDDSLEEESQLEESEDWISPRGRNAERERKQRKLWAYRQRTMGWSNPITWTRPAFRRKLNPRFVESLMMWPPRWTSDRAVLGPEVMESWRHRALSHLRCLLEGAD